MPNFFFFTETHVNPITLYWAQPTHRDTLKIPHTLLLSFLSQYTSDLQHHGFSTYSTYSLHTFFHWYHTFLCLMSNCTLLTSRNFPPTHCYQSINIFREIWKFTHVRRHRTMSCITNETVSHDCKVKNEFAHLSTDNKKSNTSTKLFSSLLSECMPTAMVRRSYVKLIEWHVPLSIRICPTHTHIMAHPPTQVMSRGMPCPLSEYNRQ